MTLRIPLLAAVVLPALLAAQDSRPSTVPQSANPAAALLKQIDERIYSAEAAGLASVEFDYRPPASGPREIPAFLVHVRWEKGRREEVGFRQPDGSQFETLPEFLTQPSPVPGAPTVRETFEQGARGIVDLFRGVSYSDRYSRWTKVLETHVVNGREERTIVCEPPAAGRFRRAEISLDAKGLPWRVVHHLSRPESGMDRMIDELVWTDFDGKLIMSGFKKTWGALSEEIAIKYQRKAGFLVPSSYEKHAPAKEPVAFVFENVRLNEQPATSRPAK